MSDKFRWSDGKAYKGYKVFHDGSIELAEEVGRIMRELWSTLGSDLNINISRYRYDRTRDRLVPLSPIIINPLSWNSVDDPPPSGSTVVATDEESLWLDRFDPNFPGRNRPWCGSPLTGKAPTKWWPVPAVGARTR